MSIVYAEQLFQWLLNQEDCDDDDHRFYCSYLIAHSSLSMAAVEDDDQFFNMMTSAIVQSLKEDKLSERDKTGITALWQQACDIRL